MNKVKDKVSSMNLKTSWFSPQNFYKYQLSYLNIDVQLLGDIK